MEEAIALNEHWGAPKWWEGQSSQLNPNEDSVHGAEVKYVAKMRQENAKSEEATPTSLYNL